MGYTNKEKLEWTMIFIHEFAEKNGLNMKQSFGYLSRFKGIDFKTIITVMSIHNLLKA